MFWLIILLMQVCTTISEELEYVDCGVDDAPVVYEGEVKLKQYPWVGILYYTYRDMNSDARLITSVALIHREFVIGSAADIGVMPKHDFRRRTRVLLGENWSRKGRRVRNYIIHPEYGETYNTIALVQLKDIVRINHFYQLCPPPNSILKNPAFYVVKMKEDPERLEKHVLRVMHVPGKMCKDFYVAANLYERRMRPPHVACAVSLETNEVCVWDAGAALVIRDVWGRWQLLGLGVRGPGCGAPARFLDIMSYLPWIEQSLEKFQRVTITKINNQNYVLRSAEKELSQRFGDCDTEEMQQMLYRESFRLFTDNNQRQNINYNLTILDHVEFTCLTLALINATASSIMTVRHYCPREPDGKPCYVYKYSSFDISVEMSFADSCWFEMIAYGWHRNMTLLDIQEWKWQEGAYYADFNLEQVEYRGQSYMTDFGFEPVDMGMWIPEYDLWTTTLFPETTQSTLNPLMEESMRTRSTTTPPPTSAAKGKIKWKTSTTNPPPWWEGGRWIPHPHAATQRRN